MSLSRLIFVHLGPFAYQTFDLSGPSALSGASLSAQAALTQALQFLFDPQPGSALCQQWLRRPEARLAYEIQGEAGPFLLVVLPGESRPVAYLLNSDYDRSLLVDGKGRVRSAAQLLAEMKQRGLGHSERMSDASIWWQHFEAQQNDPQARYRWFPRGYRAASQRLLGLTPQPARSTLADLRSLLTAAAGPGLALDPLRSELRQLARHQREIDWLTQQQDLIDQFLETAQRYRLGQEALDAQRQALRPQVSRLPLYQARAAQRVQQARQAQAETAQGHQARLHALEAELALTLRQIGAMEARLAQGQQLADHYQHLDLRLAAAAHANLSTTAPSVADADAPLPSPGPSPATQDLRAAWQQRQARLSELTPALAAAQQRVEACREDLLACYRQPLPPWPLREEVLAARERTARLQAEQQRHQGQQQELEAQRQQALQEQDTREADAQAAYQSAHNAQQQRLTDLRARVQQSSQSFMAWLEGRYPDWQETIGKVVREEVLLHPYLSPSVERLNDLLFGVQLDLSELETPDLGPGRLQQACEALAAEIAEAETAWQQQQQEFARQRQNLEKRFRQKLSAHAREGQQLRYRVEQAQQQEQRQHQRLRAAQQAQQQRREQLALTLAYRLEAAQTEVAQLRDAHTEVEAQWETAWAAWEASQATPSLPTADPEADSPVLPDDAAACLALAQQWHHYQQDHARWIAPLSAWNDALARLRRQELRLRADRDRQVDGWPRQAAALQAEVEAAEAAVARWETAAATWAKWAQQGLGETEPTAALGEVPETALAEGLEAAAQAQAHLTEQAETLRQQAQALAAGLSPDNVLRLPVEMVDPSACLALADALMDYVGGGRWPQVQQELAGRYAPLVARLASQVQGFDQLPGLAARVKRLNQALQQAGVGLRVQVEASDQPLARALQALLAFAEQQGPGLGDGSLFNQGSNGAVDEEALARLMRLHQALESRSGAHLTGADTFALRIEQRAAHDVEWAPWQPWRETAEALRLTWQRLLLAAWAALEVKAGWPLPLVEVSEDTLLLSQMGKLAPLWFDSPVGVAHALHAWYQLDQVEGEATARQVMALA